MSSLMTAGAIPPWSMKAAPSVRGLTSLSKPRAQASHVDALIKPLRNSALERQVKCSSIALAIKSRFEISQADRSVFRAIVLRASPHDRE